MGNLSIYDDGFDDTSTDNRLIQGTLIRCVDGVWSSKDKLELPDKLLALGTVEALQRWENGKPTETITKKAGEALPDVEELNSTIDEAAWEDGPGGRRPPWVHCFVVYLVDSNDAAKYTFCNSTWGARRAVDILKDKVRTMRLFRGQHVTPVVQLDSAPMSTQFGMKRRPEFKIVSWVELGGGGELPKLGGNGGATMIEHKPAESAKEIAAKSAFAPKEVKRPSVSEEIDDDLPDNLKGSNAA
jgi:hypothetical protein